MPQFNLIQRPDLSDKLARALKINERNPAPVLAPDVQAVVLVENLTTQSPYVRSLTREASGEGNVGAVVGQFSGAQLKNPAGSNVVAVVRRLFASVGTSIECIWGYHDQTFGTDRASTLNRFWKDIRLAGPSLAGFPTCTLLGGTKAAAQVAPSLGRGRINGGNALEVDELGIVVPPGFSFEVEHATVNIGGAFTVEWTEYTGNE